MNDSDVAIIGMGVRFPGAGSVAEFWHNLVNGVHALRPFTEAELEASGVSASARAKPNYVKAGYPLADIELFDADFFGFTPRDAQIMDPQQRILLECTWEAIEDAGYKVSELHEGTGVFAGTFVSTYWNAVMSDPALVQSVGPLVIRHANDKDYLATRISYKLNLTGPSASVQTSCSTSLMAVHLACQSLVAGECDRAIAGGVSIGLPQQAGYTYEQGGIMSPDGFCRTFDRGANGTAFSSGAGVVLLKRAGDAVRDHDNIYAVIKGSAANNDGARKVGFTAPSIDGQAQVITEALLVAGVPFESIGYIEAHGTATPMGDPIEIAALTQAFRERTDRTQFCGIGSVKSNIGHCGAASGIAGLVKAALTLRHRKIPPTLHFAAPNPAIDFARTPFRIVAKLHDWTEAATPRRVGVSSFGMGGTNIHAVLEEAPAQPAAAAPAGAVLLPLSATTPAALAAARHRLAAAFDGGDVSLADAAFTLQRGRMAFAHRDFAVASTPAQAAAQLRSPLATGPRQPVAAAPKVFFLFPGQGAQYAEMGRGLYEFEPVFRREFDRLCDQLMPRLGRDFRTGLFAAGASERTWIDLTEHTQPALFAFELALARAWAAYGVRPAGLLGHSLGEYVAACLAGVFSDADALHLLVERGRLFGATAEGAMLGVQCDRATAERYGGNGVEIAACNAPRLHVLAGGAAAIARLQRELDQAGIAYTRLRTTHAFHTALLEPALEQYHHALERVTMHRPAIPFVSNVTGQWADPDEVATPDYWVRHSRAAVQFATGIATLAAAAGDEPAVWLEVGPGTTLGTLAQANLAQAGTTTLASLRHPKDPRGDAEVWLSAVGALWKAHCDIQWEALPAHGGKRISLPTYPFQRQRHWVAHRPGAARVAAAPVEEPWTELVWRRSPRLRPAWVAHLATAPCYLFAGPEHAATIALRNAVRVRNWVTLETDGETLRCYRGQEFETMPWAGGAALASVLDAHRCDQVRIVLGADVAADLPATVEREVAIQAIAVLRRRSGERFSFNVIAAAAGERELPAPAMRIAPLACSRWLQIDERKGSFAVGESLLAECEAPVTASLVVLDAEGREAREPAPSRAGTLPAPGGETIVACDDTELRRALEEPLAATGPGAAAPVSVVSVAGPSFDVLCAGDADLAGWLESARRRIATWSETLPPVAAVHVVALTGHPALHGAAAMYQQAVNRLIVEAVERSNRRDPDRRLVFVDLGCYRWAGISLDGLSRPARDYVQAHAVDRVRARDAMVAAMRQWSRWMTLGPRGAAVSIDAADFMSQSAPLVPTPPALSGSTLADTIARIFAETLGRPVADPNQSFFEAGGNSLTALQAVARLRQTLGQEIPLSVLLSSPTVNGIAAALAAAPAAAAPAESPADPLVAAVARVFGDVLGRQEVRPTDNFFQLGGNSLTALQAVSRLREQFKAELPLAELLAAPTPAAVAQLLGRQPSPPAEADAAAVDALLQELEGMSPDDLRRQLSDTPAA
jgi:phthiocerol/phenolphthiocerol synthesis type-I polyketide synthase E